MIEIIGGAETWELWALGIILALMVVTVVGWLLTELEEYL